MAIPDKPLLLKDYDVGDMTLDEECLFADGGFSPIVFRQFLMDHVDHEKSWTVNEIKKLTRKDRGEVCSQLVEKLTELIVPLENKPRSSDGHGASPTQPPAGPTA